MGAEVLGRPLSDGSYWTINLSIAATTDPTHCPPEGVFKMDLCFNRTCLVESQEFGISQTVVPTLHLPGTMNRAEYYTALQQWLQSLRGNNQLPLEGEVVNDFTDHVMERVFGRVNFLHNVAVWVHADLRLVSYEYASFPMESEADEEEFEYEEEEDDEEYGQILSDFYRVVAAEEHQRFGDCSICLEGLVPTGEVKSEKNYLFGSPCGHFFHSECMDKWLRMSSFSCPLCRFDMS